MTNVTIHLLSKGDQRYFAVEEFASSHRTDAEREAIARAVRKHFGSGAFFQRDNGLSFGNYGQIFRTITRSGETFHATNVTGRVRIDVEA